ncbi:MAG: hypothetical protein IJW45_03780 [Oscillospiraceae bacterium]|nr:hypothetical protein [Oscillospiraceae bacterium]
MGKAAKCLFAALGMAMMILDNTTAFQGAQEGIGLCIKTLIPSLFPFLILSTLLVGNISGSQFDILAPICKAFRISRPCVSLIVLGILGGYPAGAICVGEAYKSGSISRDTARKMLPICNQCGPAFLFGILGTLFHSSRITWSIWGITILSALTTLWFLPGNTDRSEMIISATSVTLTKALDKAVHTMGSICGWVVLFRVMIAFLHRWLLWMAAVDIRVVISGFLELSNGCLDASSIDPEQVRYMLCVAMIVLGGACVTMQTFSVTPQNIDRSLYIPGKITQCLIALVLAWIAGWLLFDRWIIPLYVPGICILGLITSYGSLHRKNSSISRMIRV